MDMRANIKRDIQDRISRLTNSDEDEYMRMQLLVALYEPRESVRYEIESAYNDSNWDWTKSDGCSGVSQLHSPKGYRFPCCVAHDHGCEVAKKGLVNRQYVDKVFYQCMYDFKVNPIRAWLRWAGVRIFWLGWGKWINMLNRKARHEKSGTKNN